MPETAFLDALANFLQGSAGLVPTPALVGIAVPVAVTELPALALALPSVERVSGGAGGAGEPVTGALPVEARIDLANPVLPGLEDFSLVSADRRELILPHGGLVRADGTEGPLGVPDIAVTLDSAPVPLAAAPPGNGQVSADALEGRLTFGTALPPTGTVVARYNVGLWERRTTMLAGELTLTAYAGAAADAGQLSVAATRALLASGLPGLRKLVLVALGAIGAADAALAGARARQASFRFQYEHVVDDPASAGGIIRRIPLTTVLNALRLDRASGVVVEERETETG